MEPNHAQMLDAIMTQALELAAKAIETGNPDMARDALHTFEVARRLVRKPNPSDKIHEDADGPPSSR